MLEKVTLNLRAGDMEKIQNSCAGSRLTASEVIRSLVSKFVDSQLQPTDTPREISLD